MANVTTEVNNIIKSHLGRTMFGMNIYGRHEHTFFDGKENRTMIIEVKGANRFERYGQVIVYHPHHGKWVAKLLSEHHSGKPVQALTTAQIQESIQKALTADYIYTVYGRPDVMPDPVSFDPYWEKER